MNTHSYILTIAGHDPSGGAGMTSDIKTFESHGLYGLSVCTALTVQNDVHFNQCIWTPMDVIISQIEIVFERFYIPVVKIGIVENWKTLSFILETLHRLNSNIKVVLDPVFKASTGFDFHSTESQILLDDIWKQCFIITPNYDEIQNLYPELTVQKTMAHINNATKIYLKGGHRTDSKKGWDTLSQTGEMLIDIPPNVEEVYEKHGSGCVLSSSLASHIALGLDLENAAIRTKKYVENFLQSSKSLLGTHAKQINIEH